MRSSGHGIVVSTTADDVRRKRGGFLALPLAASLRFGFDPPSWAFVAIVVDVDPSRVVSAETSPEPVGAFLFLLGTVW